MPIDVERLKKAIIELGLASAEQVAAAEKEAERAGISFFEAVVSREILTDEQLGQVEADLLGMSFVNLRKVPVPDAVLSIIPEVAARSRRAIAYARDARGLRVAMNNPEDLEFIRSLRKKVGEPVTAVYATTKDIEEAFSRYRKDIREVFSELIDKQIKAAGEAFRPEDLPITKIVDTLLAYAYENNASDLHIEPQEKKTVVRFRIDGVLHDAAVFPKRLHDLVVSRIKILAKLKTDEHRAAQDGKFRMIRDGVRVDVRVSVAPIVEGEKAVLRLLSEKARAFALPELGFSPSDVAKVTAAIEKPFGMIMATGPTGSGKTTTLYALVKILNERDVNIATIEDPVEYEIEGINQIQVNPDTNLTFADGLKSIVRQDPDIIMVGEIRDPETASIAVNAAMTGHLLLSTLHTNDAATAFPRLLEMKVEPFLIASSTNIVIAQRLVRRICRQCIESYETPISEVEKSVPKAMIEKLVGPGKKTLRLFRGQGCDACGHSGRMGRVGVYEIIEMTDTLREMVMRRADAGEIRRQAISDGMTTMFEDGLAKVFEGMTTFEEVIRETKV